MSMVALWCVQYLPEVRPLTSIVVKMLEGGLEISSPSNPFRYLESSALRVSSRGSSKNSSSSLTSTAQDSEFSDHSAPLMSAVVLRPRWLEIMEWYGEAGEVPGARGVNRFLCLLAVEPIRHGKGKGMMTRGPLNQQLQAALQEFEGLQDLSGTGVLAEPILGWEGELDRDTISSLVKGYPLRHIMMEEERLTIQVATGNTEAENAGEHRLLGDQIWGRVLGAPDEQSGWDDEFIHQSTRQQRTDLYHSDIPLPFQTLPASSRRPSHSQAPKKADSSWTWRSVQSSIVTINNHSLWQIRTGQRVQFWTDPWIPHDGRRKPNPRAGLSMEERPQWVNHFIDPVSRSWRREELFSWCDDVSAELISHIYLPHEGNLDELRWYPSKDGKFSIKFTYRSLMSSNHMEPVLGSPSFFLHFWKNKASPRDQMFAWKCLRDMIPCRDKIASRLSSTNISYPLCLDHTETLHHFLLECAFTRAVWFGTSFGGMLYKASHLTVQEWITQWILPPSDWPIDRDIWTLVIFSLYWMIWKARCDWTFQNIKPDPVSIFLTLNKMIANEPFF
ncbi:hypothetical protein GIB67_031129 [Kingdonia uniflora]|uniref:Reverse transcriptase zinc-binding domain-containing protein n=1 Tax=Kingdonia uniflora TaxID=39325 RepID=A0A7J7ME59_9MAGN|nr:hypothetical protein GIB67_031129 [Kingdonia uniflora]